MRTANHHLLRNDKAAEELFFPEESGARKENRLQLVICLCAPNGPSSQCSTAEVAAPEVREVRMTVTNSSIRAAVMKLSEVTAEHFLHNVGREVRGAVVAQRLDFHLDALFPHLLEFLCAPWVVLVPQARR